MQNPFDDVFGPGFGDMLGNLGLGRTKEQRAQDTLKEASDHLAEQRAKQAKKDVPKPQIRAKQVDGVWFVRAGDVAAVLEASGMSGHPLVAKLKRLS